MARDFNSGSFVADEYESAEDADPRIGLVNLADVMLVFACGLMLALVTYWNLDVSTMTEVIEGADVTEVADIEEMTDPAQNSGSGFVDMGKVYKDPMTGKLYMRSEDVESGGTSDASSTND